MTEDEKLHEALKNKGFVVAVDLDGTLAEYDTWRGFFYIGRPLARVVELVRKYKDMGAKVIVYTCRSTTADNKVYHEAVSKVKDWLIAEQVPYDEIWMAVGKPGADVYIDDKARNPHCKECWVVLEGMKG